MFIEIPRPARLGRKARVIGVGNDSSIAHGCARAFHELGAERAVTHVNDKARPHVEALVQALRAPLVAPLMKNGGTMKAMSHHGAAKAAS